MADRSTYARHFAMPEGCYLLSHSVGCLAVDAPQILEERYFAPWRRSGGNAWPVWLEEIGRFRAAIARLIGGNPDEIVPQANVSSALSKVIPGLPRREGRHRIVCTEEDFPSLGFVLQAASALGYEVRFLPAGHDADSLEAWDAALDETVQLALVTHAFSNRSARLPVGEITRMARERGVFSFVDAVQTLGVVPVSVGDWQADFLAGSCVKFLCGGPGAGFLWIAPAMTERLEPLDTGWFSHADPFAFDIRDYRLAETADRLWGGTPSVAPYVLAAHAVELLLDIGVEAIHEHNQRLIDRLHRMVPAEAIGSERERQRRGNAVLLAVRDATFAQAILGEEGISADLRQGHVRVSPHIYNSDEDIDRLVDIWNRRLFHI